MSAILVKNFAIFEHQKKCLLNKSICSTMLLSTYSVSTFFTHYHIITNMKYCYNYFLYFFVARFLVSDHFKQTLYPLKLFAATLLGSRFHLDFFFSKNGIVLFFFGSKGNEINMINIEISSRANYVGPQKRTCGLHV